MTTFAKTIRGIRDRIAGGDARGRGIKLLGRKSQGDGPLEVLDLTELLQRAGATGSTPADIQALLDSIGNTQGDILYRDASAWAALAPGTAGKVLVSGGSGANPAWSTAGAAGVTPVYGFHPTVASSDTQATACKGNVLTPIMDMSVVSMAGLLTTVTSGVYKFGIAPYNTGTNKITSAPTYTNTFTAGTGAALQMIQAAFATPVALTAGTTYIFFIVRTDATASTNLTSNFTGGTTVIFSPGVYASGSGNAFRLASLAPTTSDTWTSSGGGIWDIDFYYTIP